MENKKELKERITLFRNKLKDYRIIWFKILEEDYNFQDKESILDKEEKLREELMEDWGRLKELFFRLNIPTITVTPSIGYQEHIFEEALSGRLFDNPLKGASLINAISSATQAIGVADSLTDTEFKRLTKKSPTTLTDLYPKIKDQKIKILLSELVNSYGNPNASAFLIRTLILLILRYKLELESKGFEEREGPVDLINKVISQNLYNDKHINKALENIKAYKDILDFGIHSSWILIPQEDIEKLFPYIRILLQGTFK